MKNCVSSRAVYILLVLIVSSVGGVGGCGGGGGSDNPPNMSGTWYCTQNCSGVCIFDSVLTVTQDGDQIAVMGNTTTSYGTIDNDGNFNFSNSQTSCEGQAVNNLATADCTGYGVTCQEVTYERR